MKFLWKDLIQLPGSKNAIGYKSIVANHLYLLYCFGGNIYFTDKIHKRVRYFWYCIVSCEILYSYLIGLEYLWYERKYDLMLIMHVINFVGSINLVSLVLPLIMYLCSDRIEAMIEHVDSILNLNLEQKDVLAEAKKYFALFLIPFLIAYLGYLFLCIPDVVLFFEKEKVTNSIYYAFPSLLVEKYSSIWSFLVATSITSIVYTLMLMQVWSVFGLLLYWNAICCAQLIKLKNGLHAGTQRLNVYTDEEVVILGEWNEVYDRLLEQSIKEFQETARLINYLRELIEAIGALIIINGFWIGMTILYSCYTDDISPLLKMKFLVGYIGTLIAIFLLYWIGQNLNNSVSEVSLAVYSSPWYRSVKIRKTVYIFLCQTQLVKNFAVFKVYGLLMNNFSRYLHAQTSFTNILRRFTLK